MKKNNGFSLIEILVVITLFSLLAVVAAQSTILSLRGARKSDAVSDVRDNLDFALSVIERQIRNSRSISSACDGTTSTNPLIYEDQDEFVSEFSCQNIGTDGYVASGSAQLTGSNISITACSFVCHPATGSLPPSVEISITGAKKGAIGIEATTVTVDSRVGLRVY